MRVRFESGLYTESPLSRSVPLVVERGIWLFKKVTFITRYMCEVFMRLHLARTDSTADEFMPFFI